jgi:hypothetical protein
LMEHLYLLFGWEQVPVCTALAATNGRHHIHVVKVLDSRVVGLNYLMGTIHIVSIENLY